MKKELTFALLLALGISSAAFSEGVSAQVLEAKGPGRIPKIAEKTKEKREDLGNQLNYLSPPFKAGKIKEIPVEKNISRSLPASVDNSTGENGRYFPEIGSQGSLGTCDYFTVTYYGMTYEVARANKWDVKDKNGENINSRVFSPKWPFVFTNDGSAMGTIGTGGIEGFLTTFGAATQASFPYSGSSSDIKNYREWPTNGELWREASKYKLKDVLTANSNPQQLETYITSNKDENLKGIKTMLSSGHIVHASLEADNPSKTKISDNKSTLSDDRYVGQKIFYQMGDSGAHALTIVGYNDDIWTDINHNGKIDVGEQGAFKIANSYGRGWGNDGFMWVAYDALNKKSAVPGFKNSNTRTSFLYGGISRAYEVRKMPPSVFAEVTIHQENRSSLRFALSYKKDGVQSKVTNLFWRSTYRTPMDGVHSDSNEATFAIDLSILKDRFNVLPSDMDNIYLTVKNFGYGYFKIKPNKVKSIKLVTTDGTELTPNLLEEEKTIIGAQGTFDLGKMAKANASDFVSVRDHNLQKKLNQAINPDRAANSPIKKDELKDITKLDLSHSKISDLAGMQYLINLEELNLSGNQISDIHLLKALNHLTKLHLNDQKIIEKSVWSSGTEASVENVIKGIDGSPVVIASGKDYTYDNIKNQVTFIGLSEDGDKAYRFDQQVSIGKAKARFEGTVTQHVKYQQEIVFPDINLKYAINLYNGRPKNKKITKHDLEAMKGLELEHREISSLEGLQYATNLTYLNVAHNKISDLSPLKNLSKLDELYCNYNRISDLSPLSGLNGIFYALGQKIAGKEVTVRDSKALVRNIVKGLDGKPLVPSESDGYTYSYDDNMVTFSGILGNTNKSYRFDVKPSYGDEFGFYSATVTHKIIFKPTAEPDVNAPIIYIQGVIDPENTPIEIDKGGTYDFEEVVSASDDYDGPVKVSIDSDEVDFNRVGEYKVIYRAKDKAGNTTILIRKVIIKDPKDKQVAAIPDSNLKAALNEAIDKKRQVDQDITINELKGLSGTLSLDKPGITNLEGLQYATNLTGFDLRKNDGVTDLNPIASLINLKSVYISGGVRGLDIQPLQNLVHLNSLALNSIKDVSNLHALDKLVNLERLAIRDMKNLSDIGSLAKLTQLSNLVLIDSPKISNLGSLANLEQLRQLWLTGDGISDLQPLKELKNLEFLRLNNQKITGEEVTSNGPEAVVKNRLKGLDGTAIAITSGSGYVYDKDKNQITFDGVSKDGERAYKFSQEITIGGAKSVFNGTVTHKISFKPTTVGVDVPDANLKAALNQVIDKKRSNNQKITEEEMRGLKGTIDLSDKGIVSLEGIQYAINLRGIVLNRNDEIQDLHPLEYLTNLETLQLEGTKYLSDLSPLKNLVNLTKLEISNANKLSDLQPLKDLVHLKELRLSRDQITDIHPLKNLADLHVLILADNRGLADISILGAMPQLNELWLNKTKISDLTPLKELSKLKILKLDEAHISDISPLKNLNQLAELHLDGQQVEGPEAISKNGQVVVANMLKGVDGQPVSIQNGEGYTYDAIKRQIIFNGESKVGDRTYAFKEKVVLGNAPAVFEGTVTHKIRYRQ